MANRWLKTLKMIGLQFIPLIRVRGMLWPYGMKGAMKDASFHHIDMYSSSIKPVVRGIFDFEF